MCRVFNIVSHHKLYIIKGIKTHQICFAEPDTAPSITSLKSTTSCMEIKTVKPSEPNGLIIKYQVKASSVKFCACVPTI